VYVLHDLGADHPVEGGAWKGQPKDVSLKHASVELERRLPASFVDARAGQLQTIDVEVDADHVGTAVQRTEGVSTATTACVQQPVSVS
jgi:hypothetical protein